MPETAEKGTVRSHRKCWTGVEYQHICHKPSGRTCFDCDQPAGTDWGPIWCPDCDVKRLDRVGASLRSIVADILATSPTHDGAAAQEEDR